MPDPEVPYLVLYPVSGNDGSGHGGHLRGAGYYCTDGCLPEKAGQQEIKETVNSLKLEALNVTI